MLIGERMQEKNKYLIFDLDGTILDTLSDLRNSINYMLLEIGLKEKTLSEIKSYVGNGIELLVRRALNKDVSEEDFQRNFNVFKNHYEEHIQDETKPYKNIIELLEILKARKVTLAVLSNKFQGGVDKLIEEFFPGKFDIWVGVSPKIRPKPAPDAIKYIFKKLKIKDSDICYFVGDSEVDIQTARNGGLPIISVSWGFRSREYLEAYKPDYLVDDPLDVLKIINRE